MSSGAVRSYGIAPNSQGVIIQRELAPGAIRSRYEILELLGSGGFGITYKARDTHTGAVVVIKENMPEAIARRTTESWVVAAPAAESGFQWALNRFLNEARTLASLSHVNIVAVQEAFMEKGTAYYVMPWVMGKELGKVAPPPHMITERWLSPVLRTLLGALDYLHGKNLLHRDIKPNNVLMQEDGTPLLIDFGAAKAIVAECRQAGSAVCSSMMVAAMGYTPIEQLQTGGVLGAWTDLYALGATCYKLITGHEPPDSISRTAATDPYQPLVKKAELRNRFSKAFLSNVDKALRQRAGERWQSARDWLRHLPELPAPAPEQVEASAELPQSGKGSSAPLAWGLVAVLLGLGACALPYHFAMLGKAELSADSAPVAPAQPDTELQAQLSALRGKVEELESQKNQLELDLDSERKDKQELESQIEDVRKRADSAEQRLALMTSKQLAEQVLQKQYNIEADNYSSELYYAARYAYADKLALLLDAGANVNYVNYSDKNRTPLMEAVISGKSGDNTSSVHSCIARLLMCDDVSINKKDSLGNTALHYAVGGSDVWTCLQLLSFPGIDVNIQNEQGLTPLHVAALKNKIEYVRILLSIPGIKKNIRAHQGGQSFTPLECAENEDIKKLLR